MRRFIRHPAAIPIDLSVDTGRVEAIGAADAANSPVGADLLNVSSGGLSFTLPHPVSRGANLTISMPQVWPGYAAHGTVVWCRQAGPDYEVGVQFGEENEAFKARMVAQFCQIEDYRREMAECKGRELTSEEAAREWIVQFAEEFAESMGAQ